MFCFFFLQFRRFFSAFCSLHNFWWAICDDENHHSPVYDLSFFSGDLKVFSLSLIFSSLSMMGLVMILFDCILFEVHCNSWICQFTSFTKFGKALTIISSNLFCLILSPFVLRFLLFSVSFPSRTSITHRLGLWNCLTLP